MNTKTSMLNIVSLRYIDLQNKIYLNVLQHSRISQWNHKCTQESAFLVLH